MEGGKGAGSASYRDKEESTKPEVLWYTYQHIKSSINTLESGIVEGGRRS